MADCGNMRTRCGGHLCPAVAGTISPYRRSSIRRVAQRFPKEAINVDAEGGRLRTPILAAEATNSGSISSKSCECWAIVRNWF